VTEPDDGPARPQAEFHWPTEGGPDEGGPGAGAGPRPVLVGVASLLLVSVGFLEVLLATLVFAALGTTALVLALPLGLLAAGAIVAAVRILARRSRNAALAVSLITLVVTPFTLGVGQIGLVVSVCLMVAIVALVRHRAWFRG
jgi:hypothetical protein